VRVAKILTHVSVYANSWRRQTRIRYVGIVVLMDQLGIACGGDSGVLYVVSGFSRTLAGPKGPALLSCSLQRSLPEGIARLDLTRIETTPEPSHALFRRSMGK